MRTLTYRLMFALVASGTVVDFFTTYLSNDRWSFFLNRLFLTGFSKPLPELLFSTIPLIQGLEFLIKPLKIVLLSLVLYRLYKILTERQFNAPTVFNGRLFAYGAIGVLSLCIFLILILSLTLNMGFYLGLIAVFFSAIFFVTAQILLPLILMITEFLYIKEQIARA